MKWLTPLLLCCLAAGCAAASAAPTVSEYDIAAYKATVALSAASLDKPDVAPAKPLRKDCKVCNGTGKVRSGDGLLIFDCTACLAPEAAAINSPEIPDSSREVAFGGPTIRTSDPGCDCQTTGLCLCGPACECVGQRTRTAYLYTTSGCAPCERAKGAILSAAASGRLPRDLRVVVAPSPAWVKAFPTLHFQAGGSWYQTHDPETFFRDCNGLVATTSPTVMNFGETCGPFGCSSGGCSSGFCSIGSCASGGCSGGSCGGGFGRSFGFGGGFRFGGGGGGCSSCGR